MNNWTGANYWISKVVLKTKQGNSVQARHQTRTKFDIENGENVQIDRLRKKSDWSRKFYKSKILNNEAVFAAKIVKKGTAMLQGLQPASGLKIQNRFLVNEF